MDSTRWIEVGGHALAYHRQGRGEPVLLVHGIPTWSFIWRDLFERLSADYDVIAVDLLGCGESDKPLDVSYSIRAHAERLHLFSEALGIDRLHYVGHDLGGAMGQVLLVEHPEMLLDAALLNPVAHDFWPVQPISSLRAPVLRQLLMASLDLGLLRLIIRRALYHPERADADLVADVMRPLSSPDGRKALLHFARCLDSRDLVALEDRWSGVETRVLIVRGEDDRYLSAESALFLSSRLGKARLERMARAGHLIQIDQPDRLYRSLHDFLGAEP